MFVDGIVQPRSDPDSLPGLERMPLPELERQIGRLASDINAATCRWLLLVAEFERRAGHERYGFTSCATWLRGDAP